MKFFVSLFLLSILSWVLPAQSRSIVQRNLASVDVNKLSHRQPYIHRDGSSGFSGEFKFQYQQNTIEDDHFFSGAVARFKGGWQGSIVENWDWGFKLASGGWIKPSASEHAHSTTVDKTRNQPLGGFSGRPIWLDSFNITYSATDDLSIRLGQMDNPYFDKDRYNLIWDEDLTPSGLTSEYRRELTDRYTLDLIGSLFFMDPLSSWMGEGSKLGFSEEKNDLSRYMLAASARISMVYDDYDFITQVAYYDINVKGIPLDNSYMNGSKNLSNSVVRNSDGSYGYKGNYSVLDISLQLKIKNFWKPFTASVQLIQNFEATTEEYGVVAGGVLGDFKRAHAWNVGYHFFTLGRDATVSSFTDLDAGGMGTTYKGHRMAFNYFLNSSVQLGFKYIFRQDGELAGNRTDHIFFSSLAVNI